MLCFSECAKWHVSCVSINFSYIWFVGISVHVAYISDFVCHVYNVLFEHFILLPLCLSICFFLWVNYVDIYWRVYGTVLITANICVLPPVGTVTAAWRKPCIGLGQLYQSDEIHDVGWWTKISYFTNMLVVIMTAR